MWGAGRTGGRLEVLQILRPPVLVSPPRVLVGWCSGCFGWVGGLIGGGSLGGALCRGAGGSRGPGGAPGSIGDWLWGKIVH